jgi:hypothetical protein
LSAAPNLRRRLSPTAATQYKPTENWRNTPRKITVERKIVSRNGIYMIKNAVVKK